jgi:hypothetical protein
MDALSNQRISCPYCGENIDVVIDCSVDEQEYIEDCQVCCRPITFKVGMQEDGEPQVDTYHENE